jgi:thioesterase domain-containing protein
MVQPGRSKPPFFCLMGGTSVLDGSGSLKLRQIAQLLGEDQPVFTFQQETSGEDVPADKVVGVLTARFVEDLLASFPEGPYYLGGYSFGALVALELARQLHALGQTVGMLALIDLWGPDYPRRTSRLEREAWHWEKMRRLPVRQGIRYIADRFYKAAQKQMPRFHRLLDKVGFTPPQPKEDADKAMAFVGQAFDGHRQTMQLYPGPVILLRATEPLDVAAYSFDDPDNRLSAFVEGGVEVRAIPGDHFTVLADANLPALAAELHDCLQTAHAPLVQA